MPRKYRNTIELAQDPDMGRFGGMRAREQAVAQRGQAREESFARSGAAREDPKRRAALYREAAARDAVRRSSVGARGVTVDPGRHQTITVDPGRHQTITVDPGRNQTLTVAPSSPTRSTQVAPSYDWATDAAEARRSYKTMRRGRGVEISELERLAREQRKGAGMFDPRMLQAARGKAIRESRFASGKSGDAEAAKGEEGGGGKAYKGKEEEVAEAEKKKRKKGRYSVGEATS